MAHGLGELLRDTLPRVEPGTESAHLVRRTAVDYLPSTLRAYLDLPADWARTHRVDGTMTSRDLLREQLDVLQAGAADLFHTVCEQDARQLQANGVFLRDRFSPTTSSLNLPRPGGTHRVGITRPRARTAGRPTECSRSAWACSPELDRTLGVRQDRPGDDRAGRGLRVSRAHRGRGVLPVRGDDDTAGFRQGPGPVEQFPDPDRVVEQRRGPAASTGQREPDRVESRPYEPMPFCRCHFPERNISFIL